MGKSSSRTRIRFQFTMAFVGQYEPALCIAIGSAGKGVGGYTKSKSQRMDADSEYSLLATKQAIDRFKTWAASKRYKWYGSVEVSGSCGRKNNAVDDIKSFLRACKSSGLRPIIYYTGHGDKSGNWVFPDGTVTFKDIYDYANQINCGWVVNVISDFCYSGQWVQQSNRQTAMNVLAASGANECAINEIFSQAYFEDSGEHLGVLRDLGACYTRAVNGKGCVIFGY